MFINTKIRKLGKIRYSFSRRCPYCGNSSSNWPDSGECPSCGEVS